MPTEYEIKLKIPEERICERIWSSPQVTPLLQEPPRTVEMCAAYYDTPTHDFNRRKWALRLRREGGVPICALKIDISNSNGVYARHEWQCESETIEEGIRKLIDLGAPPELSEIAENTRLVERCRIEFSRTVATLLLPNDEALSLSTDVGAIHAGEKEEALLELECELIFGSEVTLQRFTESIRSAFDLELQLSSKYDRALRLIRSRTQP